MKGGESNLTDLAERALAGDGRAREQMLGLIEPVLRSFFVRRIGLRVEVDDLVQNTLLRIHTGLQDLKDVSRLKGFAMKAALFELQDLYRGRYRGKERIDDLETMVERVTTEQGTGLRLDVERALETLTPRARRIIELREYGYRYEEIAEMVGTTEAAVKMQVKRAFERMRDTLATMLFFALTWRVF
jgi:RNA polymerase sigma-70 factor, ECF subfamily